MSTTAPTTRKQYGLRWLFSVIAVVSILLAINRYYVGTAFTVKHKVHLIRNHWKTGVGMTRAEVEDILGKPQKSERGGNMTIDTYPGGFGNPYVVVYHDDTSDVIGVAQTRNDGSWTIGPD